MPQERQYCSDLSRAADEPMAGTADKVDVWLLLEYKPVWKPKAIDDNALASTTHAWVQDAVTRAAEAGMKVRPQFIRRPELDTESVVLMVARDGRLWRGEFANYDAVVDVDILDADATQSLAPVDDHQYFVCTNGQRDMCCARYGLPTYARLRELVDRRVWQTTHLGGHRFAPNVLALPQGVLYGRVDPEDASLFVEAIENDTIAKPFVRGRSAFPPQAQVAEVLVDAKVLGLKGIDGDTVALETVDGDAAISVSQQEVPIDVVASCGDEATKPIYPIIATG